MKRLSYMACLLLASAAFTACDEDFKDWADPQSNPQEEAITAMVDITPVASMKLEEQPGCGNRLCFFDCRKLLTHSL